MLSNLSGADLGIVFVAILLSMGLHEAMHGFVAHWLGDTTAKDAGRLTLNPLKHVDIMTTVLLPVVLIAVGLPPIFAAKPVPFNPARVKYEEYGAAMIGLAGPFTNLVLAALSAGVVHLLIRADVSTTIVNALGIFAAVNVGFFVFNMLPIPPLDGSRLIYALVPESVQEAMAWFEQLGIGAVLLILIILMPIIGPFVAHLNDLILIRLL